jgi:hypothetical protein
MGMALGSFGGGGAASDFGFSSFMASDTLRGLISSSANARLIRDWPAAGVMPAGGTTASPWQKTKGTSDVYVRRDVLSPAGGTGSIRQASVIGFGGLNGLVAQSPAAQSLGERSLAAFRREHLLRSTLESS